MDYICGKRLAPILKELIPRLIRFGEIRLTREAKDKLMKISPATIDRILAAERKKYKIKGRANTKPGTLLKNQIPIRTFSQWNDKRPGFVEIDLVGHDGGDGSGDFLQTLDVTDVATGWTETQAVRNKAQQWVFEALKDIRGRLPFPLLGIDSDNGGEFINNHLYRYCQYSDNDTDWTTYFSFSGLTVDDYAPFVNNDAYATRFSHPDLSYSDGSGLYWRLLIDEVQEDDGYIEIAEIQMRTTSGGADQCTGGVSGSANIYSTYVSARAFDDDNSTVYLGYLPGWIFYGFPERKQIVEITVRSSNDSWWYRVPSRIRLQKSDDCRNWVTVLDGDSGTWTQNEEKTFPPFPTSGPSMAQLMRHGKYFMGEEKPFWWAK